VRPNFRSRPLIVLSALFLSGCITLGPDFETPESQVESQWLTAEDARVKADPAQTLEWWRSFGDPILESLIRQAHERNPTLQIAGLRVYEARAIVGGAVGLLYPQVQQAGFTAGALELSENAEPISNLPGSVRSGVDTKLENFRLGFDAAWELDFWGRYRRSLESADAHLAATIASYDDVLVTLTGEVAAAYVLLRTLEERLAVAESNVALQARSLEISEVRSRNQLTTELDPALARALLRGTQAQVPDLQAAIRKVKNALSVLLDKPPGMLDAELGTGGKIPTSPVEVALGLPSDLLRRRPDVRRAEFHAAAQSARIGIAKADFFPAVSLVGSIGWSSESTGDLLDSASRLGFGLVGVRWNILNYGRIISLKRSEDALFQQLIVNYQNTVLRAAREVEDATASFLAAHEQVAFLEDGANASERAVELSMIQYRDGVADYTRVLDSQRFLLLQQDALTQARGRVAGSLIAVYKALGGGWEQRDLDALISDENREAMRERTYWGDLLKPGGVEPEPEEDRGKWRLPDW
jgi:NodT family efflux transporter outer membrane factor (OMF) lipoprotein